MKHVGVLDPANVTMRRAAPARAGSNKPMRLATYALVAAGDAVAIAVAILAANLCRGTGAGAPFATSFCVSAVIFFGVIVQRQPYTERFFSDWRRTARDALVAMGTTIAVMLLISSLLAFALPVTTAGLVAGAAAGASVMLAVRAAIYRGVAAMTAGRPIATVLIVDDVPLPAPPGVRVIDAVDSGLVPDVLDPLALDRLSNALGDGERVVVSCSPARRAAWAATLRGTGAQCEIAAPELGDLGMTRLARLGDSPSLVISVGPLGTTNRFLKRAFDLAVAVTAVVLLSPVLLAVAVAVRIDSPGPIVFRQPRMGRGNAIFDVLKFRSMRVAACDSAGAQSTLRDDDRVTRVGRFIRATSIDELPQLFNVLRGEMSIVGPRPHALGSLAGERRFWEVDPRYSMRHAIKPGITGLAQIRGFRGATHATEDLENRLRCDLAYMHHWTIWRDLWIVLLTLRVLVHRNAF